jgi:DNA-binding MarR family transcriptional regulator
MTTALAADPRLILSEEELDRAVELFLLAETKLWQVADQALAAGGFPANIGRSHMRAALLLKRRPGLGVQDLARLTGLSKQGASRVLKELIEAGFADVAPGALDARRRPTHLTAEGMAFETAIASALRLHFASAYREGGIDAAPGARRIMTALAGSRAASRRKEAP